MEKFTSKPAEYAARDQKHVEAVVQEILRQSGRHEREAERVLRVADAIIARYDQRQKEAADKRAKEIVVLADAGLSPEATLLDSTETLEIIPPLEENRHAEKFDDSDGTTYFGRPSGIIRVGDKYQHLDIVILDVRGDSTYKPRTIDKDGKAGADEKSLVRIGTYSQDRMNEMSAIEDRIGVPEGTDFVMLIPIEEDGKITHKVRALTPNSEWSIGRADLAKSGMGSTLPATIDEDHCKVKVDESGKIKIENHSPRTNTAFIPPRPLSAENRTGQAFATDFDQAYELLAATNPIEKTEDLKQNEAAITEARNDPENTDFAIKLVEVSHEISMGELQRGIDNMYNLSQRVAANINAKIPDLMKPISKSQIVKALIKQRIAHDGESLDHYEKSLGDPFDREFMNRNIWHIISMAIGKEIVRVYNNEHTQQSDKDKLLVTVGEFGGDAAKATLQRGLDPQSDAAAIGTMIAARLQAQLAAGSANRDMERLRRARRTTT